MSKRLQRKVAKIILNKPKTTSTHEIYKQLKWLHLEDRWTINRCITVNKCIQKQVPDYLHDHFHLIKDTHNHRTRSANNNKIKVLKFRTTTGQTSFQYQGAIDYNNIPHSLYSETSHNIFKNNLKKHFLTVFM